ncbi:MAG: hypothetical protein JSR59_11580 [Proteobacteria bacterium]|nr:hypothetical protein [Pseudomonadota bacterium]
MSITKAARRRAARWLAATGLLAALPAWSQDAAALAARLAALRSQLANSAFQHPLHMESAQNGDELEGNAYALIEQPFAVAAPALQGADHWCDILMLHLDVKGCRPTTASPPHLSVAIARKYDQPIANANWIDFSYEPAASTPGYLLVRMHAKEGPMSTHNYRIVLEAMPADAKHTFIHLSFSYGAGFAARLAMEGYFATFGRSKVGFSVVGKKADGSPIYVGNVRGLMERNTMRYFLAIDAYVDAWPLPAAAQPEQRLQNWVAGAERYPIQLHEMERDEYLAMKRREMLAATAKPLPTAPSPAPAPARANPGTY